MHPAKQITDIINFDYSIILPVYNEEACLEELIKRIQNTFKDKNVSFEIICVDDGSVDATWSIINDLNQEFSYIKGVKFSRNFGHQLAVYAGIGYATGKFMAIMDADGQDPPEILPDMFNKCENGYDVVYAIRKNRKESIFKKICYSMFYKIYRVIVPFNVPLDSGDFTVFTRKVGGFIQSLPEKRPFIRGLRSWFGGKQVGFEYERDERLSGKPKYSYYKLLLLAINGSVSFSKAPLRIITLLGVIFSMISFVWGIYLFMLKFTIGIPLLGWTSTTILIILFGGINLCVLGIIGEYIGDIFDEVKNRPQFLVDKVTGL